MSLFLVHLFLLVGGIHAITIEWYDDPRIISASSALSTDSGDQALSISPLSTNNRQPGFRAFQPPSAAPNAPTVGIANVAQTRIQESTNDAELVVPPSLPLVGKSKHLTRLRNAFLKKRPKHPRARQTGTDILVIPPPLPFERDLKGVKAKARQVPVVPSDAAYGAGEVFNKFDGYTDTHGILHRTRSRSPFTKPGLWEPNPDDPHNRDHANKYWYHPESVGVDWLNGQIQWGAHFAVPAAGVGGTNGFSAVHFPTVGTFLGIPDDYD